MEIRFWLANGQIFSIFARVIILPHDSGGVLSFHVFICIGLEQVAVEDDDSEERENWIDRTSVLTKQDHEEYCQYAKEFLLDIITSLPIKE